MSILDAFYSRTYENDINKKMLYYNYDFPTEEVETVNKKLAELTEEELAQVSGGAALPDAISERDLGLPGGEIVDPGMSRTTMFE